MTNISALPQLTGAFVVTTNSDWRDTIQFNWGQGTNNAGQPIDITGISFEAQLRSTESDATVYIDMSTSNGLIALEPQLGQLSFAVPRDQPSTSPAYCMGTLPIESGVIDIIASADGQIINLNQVAGSMKVTINRGVTRQ